MIVAIVLLRPIVIVFSLSLVGVVPFAIAFIVGYMVDRWNVVPIVIVEIVLLGVIFAVPFAGSTFASGLVFLMGLVLAVSAGAGGAVGVLVRRAFGPATSLRRRSP